MKMTWVGLEPSSQSPSRSRLAHHNTNLEVVGSGPTRVIFNLTNYLGCFDNSIFYKSLFDSLAASANNQLK